MDVSTSGEGETYQALLADLEPIPDRSATVAVEGVDLRPIKDRFKKRITTFAPKPEHRTQWDAIMKTASNILDGTAADSARSNPSSAGDYQRVMQMIEQMHKPSR